jgi:hypothetical protein
MPPRRALVLAPAPRRTPRPRLPTARPPSGRSQRAGAAASAAPRGPPRVPTPPRREAGGRRGFEERDEQTGVPDGATERGGGGARTHGSKQRRPWRGIAAAPTRWPRTGTPPAAPGCQHLPTLWRLLALIVGVTSKIRMITLTRESS